jgi:hypothetical protein
MQTFHNRTSMYPPCTLAHDDPLFHHWPNTNSECPRTDVSILFFLCIYEIWPFVSDTPCIFSRMSRNVHHWPYTNTEYRMTHVFYVVVPLYIRNMAICFRYTLYIEPNVTKLSSLTLHKQNILGHMFFVLFFLCISEIWPFVSDTLCILSRISRNFHHWPYTNTEYPMTHVFYIVLPLYIRNIAICFRNTLYI